MSAAFLWLLPLSIEGLYTYLHCQPGEIMEYIDNRKGE